MAHSNPARHLPTRPVRPLFRQPALWLGLLLWILLSGAAALLTARSGGLPFDHMRPMVESEAPLRQVLDLQVSAAFALLIIGASWWLTRGRAVPDLATRAPGQTLARRELLLLGGYGVLVQLFGWWLGPRLGLHPISLHLTGSLFGTHDSVRPGEAWTWALFNFTLYAALPYLYFRRRGYSNEALSLISNNPRADLRLILVVLALESAGELFASHGALFGLSTRQLLLGVPLSLAINFVGTVLPVMVYLVCLILPRLLKLSGSLTVTVLLGGLAYALLHVFESWTMYTSPSASTLSALFVLLQYLPPGMVKVVLTARTANAWVHALGYHAVAPHVTIDTPLIVKIFGIR